MTKSLEAGRKWVSKVWKMCDIKIDCTVVLNKNSPRLKDVDGR